MSKDFWRAVGTRAVKTVCQTAVAMLPAAATVQQVDWQTVLGTALLSGVCSVLTSVAMGLPEAQAETGGE